MLLAKWPMGANLFDGDQMAGPVPLFFSEEMDSALEGVKANPLKAHWDMMRIQKAFLMPETMGYNDAKAYSKKPRYDYQYRIWTPVVNKNKGKK